MYNRPHRLPVNIQLTLTADKNKLIIDEFVKNGAIFMPWIGEGFAETVKEMAKKGYQEYIKPYPYTINARFLENAMAIHLKKLIPILALCPAKSYEVAVKRKVASDEDLVRVFNQALALEDDITLSYIFKTEKPKSKIYLFTNSADENILARLSEKFLIIGEQNANINVKGKSPQALAEYAMAAVVKALEPKNVNK